MRNLFRGRSGMALTFVLGLLVATAGTATAGALITGKQIKDGSIGKRELSKAVRAELAERGLAGPVGPKGERGPAGPPGPAGPAGGSGDSYTKDESDRRYWGFRLDSVEGGEYFRVEPGKSVVVYDLACGTNGFELQGRHSVGNHFPSDNGLSLPPWPEGQVPVHLQELGGNGSGVRINNLGDQPREGYVSRVVDCAFIERPKGLPRPRGSSYLPPGS